MPTVVCKINDISDVADEAARARLLQVMRAGPIEPLDVGEAYPFFAVARRYGGLWLYVHVHDSHYWPSPYPLEFFDIDRLTLPRGWVARFGQERGESFVSLITFHEWADDDGYYERLLDGEAGAVAIYNRYRHA